LITCLFVDNLALHVYTHRFYSQAESFNFVFTKQKKRSSMTLNRFFVSLTLRKSVLEE